MHTRKYKYRLGIVLLAFTAILGLLVLRIFYIHTVLDGKLCDLAQKQHVIKIELAPRRGAILDRKGRELATSLKVDSVYAVARDVTEKEKTARALSPILGKSESFLLERLYRDKLFVWLDRKITREQAQKIRECKLKGIYLIDETKRYYPNNSMAAQLIGFAGTDNIGLEGVERDYDRYVCGTGGYKCIIRDAKGREVHAYDGRYLPPVDGSSVRLTIDQVIQHIAERALKKAYQKYRAKAGIAIVMDPRTGDILAMAVEPTFDLNDFNRSTQDSRRNRAITDCYEPGSVFKVVTASACLDRNVVSLNDTFNCENGAWYVVGHTLHDYHKYGTLKFRDVIAKSSNIGTVKAAMKLGEGPLYEYIKAYGFGEPTGIDLPGEIRGIVRPLKQWTRYSMTAIPMGQEVGATPIQMVSCISAVANNGVLMKPRIIEEIMDQGGQVIKEYKPVEVRRVISEGTVKKLKEAMKCVVEDGTAQSAKLKYFDAAGKTGTSQKIEPSGRYSENKYVASFAGFAPVDDPVISVCVMVDEPHPIHFGGVVSGPVFKEIAEETLNYLAIEPLKEPADKKRKNK